MSLQTLAKTFKALHQPGTPLILANVYDVLSAQIVASIHESKALATASYAIASANGKKDDDLDLNTNLTAIRGIAAVSKQFDKPLTVDIQDGYGNDLEEAFAKIIDYGAVGANLEDCDKHGKLYATDTAVDRIERALAVAKNKGVPDFTINARCDVLVQGGELEEVLERGKRYLTAGATTVFVWGGSSRGVSRQEVQTMVREFHGRLNVKLGETPGALTVPLLKELGVARISVGPTLQLLAMKALKEEAEKLLTA